MGYSVKWVVENLGITREMLRYYEEKELLPINKTHNPVNNYRDYSDEDVERIWGIKLLIGIGFSTKEIHSIMNEPDFDFYGALTKKVKELEVKHDENLYHLNFAKSIKLLGRVPTVSKMGSIKFDDFMKYAHENWNYYDDPRTAPFMQMADALVSKTPKEWSPDDFEHFINVLENIDVEEMMSLGTLQAYCQVISDMRDLDYSSDTVQKVVRLLHKYWVDHNTISEFDGKITPQFIAKHFAPNFLCGDIALMNERNYGKEGCQFIAQALAYYGGYDVNDL